jgi:hypothetical protein
LSTVFCQLVEAQFVPELQEMGGFWSRAAGALANAGLNACGRALDAGKGCRSAREKANPTAWQVWQAEQAEQGSQSASAVLMSFAPGLALSTVVP